MLVSLRRGNWIPFPLPVWINWQWLSGALSSEGFWWCVQIQQWKTVVGNLKWVPWVHKMKEIFAIHVLRIMVNGNDRKSSRARVMVDSTWFILTYIQCFAFYFSNLFIYSAVLAEYLQYSGNLFSQKVDSTDNKQGVPSSIVYHSPVPFLSLPFICLYLSAGPHHHNLGCYPHGFLGIKRKPLHSTDSTTA